MYTYALTTAVIAGLTAAAPLAHGPVTTTAAPLTQGTVNILVELELQGDGATTRNLPFGQLTAGIFSPAARLAVNGGDNIPIAQDQIICQAFSDAAGTQKIGSPFNGNLPGMTLGDGTSLVNVGSAFCSDAAGVAAFSAIPAPTIETPAPVATPIGLPTTGLTEVTIQLDFGNSAGAAQRSVPVNGQLVPSPFGPVGFKAAIQTAGAEGVTCAIFGDAAGQMKLADVLGDGEAVFFNQAQTDVPVGAFQCVAA